MARYLPLIALCLLPALAACVPVESGPRAQQTATTPQQCARDGGRWEYAGGIVREARMCVFSYPDAGRSCSDTGQCRGGCFTDTVPTPGQDGPVTGQCAADNRVAGHCRAAVENGRAGGMLCSD